MCTNLEKRGAVQNPHNCCVSFFRTWYEYSNLGQSLLENSVNKAKDNYSSNWIRLSAQSHIVLCLWLRVTVRMMCQLKSVPSNFTHQSSNYYLKMAGLNNDRFHWIKKKTVTTDYNTQQKRRKLIQKSAYDPAYNEGATVTKDVQREECMKRSDQWMWERLDARQEAEDKHQQQKKTITNDPLPVQRWEKALHH